jgi:hypothetical protein
MRAVDLCWRAAGVQQLVSAGVVTVASKRGEVAEWLKAAVC